MKRIGHNFYVHKSNIQELLSILTDDEKQIFQNAVSVCICEWVIVKYNRQNRVISLIECPTWDILDEPIVGDSYCFNEKGFYKTVKGGSKIYHRKWQFVDSSYTGFDIEESKNRTKYVDSLKVVKENKNRIGSLKFWESLGI